MMLVVDALVRRSQILVRFWRYAAIAADSSEVGRKNESSFSLDPGK